MPDQLSYEDLANRVKATEDAVAVLFEAMSRGLGVLAAQGRAMQGAGIDFDHNRAVMAFTSLQSEAETTQSEAMADRISSVFIEEAESAIGAEDEDGFVDAIPADAAPTPFFIDMCDMAQKLADATDTLERIRYIFAENMPAEDALNRIQRIIGPNTRQTSATETLMEARAKHKLKFTRAADSEDADPDIDSND